MDEEKRRHILEAQPRRANWDFESFELFNKIFSSLGDEFTICEFGVWRGAFFEQAAIWAEENNKSIHLIGYDTFDKFPDNITANDGSVNELRGRLGSNDPYTQERIKEILSHYRSVKSLTLISGDITKETNKVKADVYFIDTDTEEAVRAGLNMIDNLEAKIIVDDYYHPAWRGVSKAVNEFCKNNSLIPINISDYFYRRRTHRTNDVYILATRHVAL